MRNEESSTLRVILTGIIGTAVFVAVLYALFPGPTLDLLTYTI